MLTSCSGNGSDMMIDASSSHGDSNGAAAMDIDKVYIYILQSVLQMHQSML
jgi:hypothetical protein